jgi:hypothetical protein
MRISMMIIANSKFYNTIKHVANNFIRLLLFAISSVSNLF